MTQFVTPVTSVPSYVSGFNYNIRDLNVDMLFPLKWKEEHTKPLDIKVFMIWLW